MQRGRVDRLDVVFGGRPIAAAGYAAERGDRQAETQHSGKRAKAPSEVHRGQHSEQQRTVLAPRSACRRTHACRHDGQRVGGEAEA